MPTRSTTVLRKHTSSTEGCENVNKYRNLKECQWAARRVTSRYGGTEIWDPENVETALRGLGNLKTQA